LCHPCGHHKRQVKERNCKRRNIAEAGSIQSKRETEEGKGNLNIDRYTLTGDLSLLSENTSCIANKHAILSRIKYACTNNARPLTLPATADGVAVHRVLRRRAGIGRSFGRKSFPALVSGLATVASSDAVVASAEALVESLHVCVGRRRWLRRRILLEGR
jgi:hypothetical protein